MHSYLMYLFNSGKEKMLMRGDFDLTSVQRYTDSLKEILKQTMLNQEILFRNQVHELHQLYWVQKSLMKDLGCVEYDSYDSWNAKAHSSLLPTTSPIRHDPLVKETKFSSMAKLIFQVASTSFLQPKLLQGHQDEYHRFQQRPLDLQLSADEFIKNVEEDLPKKVDAWNTLKETIDYIRPISDGKSSNPNELSLSLSTLEDNRRKVIVRPWFGEKSQYSCQSVDVEESVKRVSDGYEKCKPSLGCVPSEIYSNSNHKSQLSVFSDLITSSCKTAQSSSFQEYSECFLKQTSPNKCVEYYSCKTNVIAECRDDTGCNNLSSKMQEFASNHGGGFDLNNIHLDDSHCSTDAMLAYPLTASSGDGLGLAIGNIKEGIRPAMFWKNEVSNCSIEASHAIREDNAVNPALVDFNSKNESPEIWARSSNLDRSGSVVSLFAPESMSKPPIVNSEDLGSCNSDHKHEDIELKSKCESCILLDSENTSMASREGSCEKSEVEDAVFSCTDCADQSQHMLDDGNGNKSPASCKSCICDHDSSSAKKLPLGTVPHALNHYSKNQLGSQDADALAGEFGLRTSDCNDLKKEWANSKRGSAEEDVLIQSVAESLVSLKNPLCYQGACMKVGAKELENEKREQPQCSSDSFELIAVNLRERNIDADSVSSRPYVLNDVGTKDFGFKLRRGRRMKDFQREILPGLASLSRQEIREDINIMEGVLRSREYRKMRAKMANNDNNWTKLVTSRRSKLNYVGRRNLSWKFI